MAAINETKEYIGTVIDNNDSNKSGRCKIRVSPLMDGMQDSLLPWAVPGTTGTFSGEGGGSLSVPKIGTVVKVKFRDGEIKSPEYYGIQRVDKNLVNEIQDDYIGSQVLSYDHDSDMSIMYQVNSGIRLYLKGSYLQISPDGMITLNHSGETTIIQLNDDKINIVSTDDITINSKNTINVQAKQVNIEASETTTIKGDTLSDGGPEFAVNGVELMKFLLNLANAVDLKYPASPGMNVNQFMAAKEKILNSKIKYV